MENTYKQAYAKFLESQKEFYSFLAQYKKKFPIQTNEKVYIKETGKTLILCSPRIIEGTGEWRFTEGFAITKSGNKSRKRTRIQCEWHMIVNGVEYSCDWNQAF